MKNNKKSYVPIHILTPIIVLIICVGILMLVLIKPADKIKVYANLAFMDELKNTPDTNSGLVIRDNNIVTDYNGQTWETGELIYPQFGELFAIIKSDAFSVDVPVYWGSESELFEKGACQSSGSSLIGSGGNSVISAHEDTYFAELKNLKEGDTLTVYTNYGEFECTVKELISFNKSETKYVAPSKDTKLTLYTCQKDVFGTSDKRVGVVCEITESKFYNKTGEESK